MLETRKLTPELLVGLGFRGWLAGYEYQDVSCWESVWNTYTAELDAPVAKRAVMELSCWVRQVKQVSCRPIEVYPLSCAGLCHDECIAVSLIAAAQHERCPALRACAFALTGASDVEAMLCEAGEFAAVLAEARVVLSPEAICCVAGIVSAGPGASLN